MGLVSCDALAKGFDVPDVKVCILCRPLRKSFTTHIQQIGRVMRSGKDKALVLDHTGNCLRFLGDTLDLWAKGVDRLDETAEKDRVARSAAGEKERKDLVCFRCQAIVPPGAPACLACGHERPRRQSTVRAVGGTTQLLTLNAASGRNFDFDRHPILHDQALAYRSFLAFTTHRKRGDVEAGRRWAAGLFKGVFGHWPPRSFDALPYAPDMLTLDVERFCRKEMARYAKARSSHAA
jgi:DNA repair protein RadD